MGSFFKPKTSKVPSKSAIKDTPSATAEIAKLISSMVAAQKKLRTLGKTSDANFLAASENLLREYFKCESAPKDMKPPYVLLDVKKSLKI